jgi:hypothetical protein
MKKINTKTKMLFKLPAINNQHFYRKIKNKIDPTHKDYDPRLHYLVEKHLN